ncbi:MAG: hypothetical protein GYA43_08665, partial [Bacteroidales bacterium]|nr:hypothetical protein [Bacteroidales bacterium]
MKTLNFLISVLFILLVISSCTTGKKEDARPKVDISEFLGQWTIDIEGGSVGWLEVHQEDKYIDADLLWVAGSVTPVASVFLAADQYLVVTQTSNVIRTRDEEGKPLRQHT